jgi:FAD synthetase
MTQNHGHDSPEAERLPLANGAPTPKRSLKDICLELRDKVDDFLRLEQTTPMLKQVQRQVLVSMGVVEEALTRYECASSPACPPSPRPPLTSDCAPNPSADSFPG